MHIWLYLKFDAVEINCSMNTALFSEIGSCCKPSDTKETMVPTIPASINRWEMIGVLDDAIFLYYQTIELATDNIPLKTPHAIILIVLLL